MSRQDVRNTVAVEQEDMFCLVLHSFDVRRNESAPAAAMRPFDELSRGIAPHIMSLAISAMMILMNPVVKTFTKISGRFHCNGVRSLNHAPVIPQAFAGLQCGTSSAS